ncbi:MAG: hypothetical protein U9O59_08850, partial [Actinomycetota bacterium]|nr:hypothetical protein [Actinomycetota bacterium]
MGLFRRKKIKRPKSTLGMALYQYDNILERDLKKILNRMAAGKNLNGARTGVVIERAMEKFDGISGELSKDKLKVDYRSDKIRYRIIEMIDKLRDVLKEAKDNSFLSPAGEEAGGSGKLEEA